MTVRHSVAAAGLFLAWCAAWIAFVVACHQVIH